MVGSWEREKSVDFPFNFQSGRNWCLLSIVQRVCHRSCCLLLLKVLSEDQQHGHLPGTEEICSISGPTPGPLSQNLHFQRNPQWFTSNSLSFIFPICKIEIIKANWQIYLGLNKMISIQRFGINFFFLSYFPLPGIWLWANFSCFWLRTREREGALSPILSLCTEEAAKAQVE